MIEVKNLTKKYGDHVAVDHLSFTVEDGQIYGFLGPNGAGKSTTMNIMTGYLGPTDGDVIINGHNILEEPEEAKRTIGYLPEIPPVYPEMTVYEYLMFAAELKKLPKHERKGQVAEAMQELALLDVKDRLIRNLSKGYKQRVGFAQALIGNPQTLILDEPTVGLDPRQIIEIRSLIKKLGQKHTVILSSHILSEVSEVCDKVMIISEGKLVACDTPENLGRRDDEHATLTLTAAGAKETVEEALAAVVDVPDGAVTTGSDGLVHVTLTLPGNEDIRSEVSRALFDRNCMIYEMHLEKASLENIFLELTDSDAEETAAEGTDATDAEDTAAEETDATETEETAASGGMKQETENADRSAGPAESEPRSAENHAEQASEKEEENS